MKNGLCPDNDFDRRNQVVLRLGLEEECARACLQGFIQEGVTVVHGEDEDLGLRGSCANLARRFDPVEDGKRIVDDGNVGPDFDRLGDGFLSVADLRHDLPARPGFENRLEAGTDHLVVVRDQDARRVSP